MDKTEYLLKKQQEIFDGDPWYGDSVMKVLKNLDFKTIQKKPFPACNSIAEIIQHIITWRTFLIKKIKGDTEFDIRQNDPNDWKKVVITSEKDWQGLIENLKESQQQIIALLKDMDGDFLTQTVSTRSYNFEYLIAGMIEHDVYHLGQITLVRKMILKSTL